MNRRLLKIGDYVRKAGPNPYHGQVLDIRADCVEVWTERGVRTPAESELVRITPAEAKGTRWLARLQMQRLTAQAIRPMRRRSAV